MEMQSAEIKDLAAALSKVQKEIKGAAMDSANPFYKSKYADLTSVWEACRALLAANNLAVVQTNGPTDGSTVTVITTLLHTSGQWIRGELTMRPVKSEPQQIGSAMTYARRYALSAIVGVCPEDDDGAAASGTVKQISKAQERPGFSTGKPVAQFDAEQAKKTQADLGTIDDYIVSAVKGKSGKHADGKPWQAYIITTQDNGDMGTYSQEVFDKCVKASNDGLFVRLETEPGKYGPTVKAAAVLEIPERVPN